MPFEVAVSGLNAASQDLSTIANNVANTNTSGFKQSRAEFADVYAVSALGSANASGSGVQLSRIAQQFTQGNLSFTENSLDLAVNGEGFFVLDDGGSPVYSRAGAFGVDRNGFVVNAQSHQLQAFQADAAGNITAALGPLQLNTGIIAPNNTTAMTIKLNLDASGPINALAFNATDPATYSDSTSATIYDSLGASHLATSFYRKLGANSWETYTAVDGVVVGGPDAIGFSSSGVLTVPVGSQVNIAAFNPGGGAANMTLTLDYAGTSQFGSPFGVESITQDGYATGRLSGIEIDQEGLIFARFTNGQSQALGQVALADFSNTQGLKPLSESTWGESFSSGTALVGGPGSSRLGLIQSGALEDSNVDLTEQLVNMIVAQRNFQANAQVISTADAVTQSVINIR